MDYFKSKTPRLLLLQPGSSILREAFHLNSRWYCASARWDQARRSSPVKRASWPSRKWPGDSCGPQSSPSSLHPYLDLASVTSVFLAPPRLRRLPSLASLLSERKFSLTQPTTSRDFVFPLSSLFSFSPSSSSLFLSNNRQKGGMSMRDLALGGADCHDGNALSAMTKHADLDRSMLQVWPPFFLFWASLPPILAKTPSCATVAPLLRHCSLAGFWGEQFNGTHSIGKEPIQLEDPTQFPPFFAALLGWHEPWRRRTESPSPLS